jgi:hypothetical protein
LDLDLSKSPKKYQLLKVQAVIAAKYCDGRWKRLQISGLAEFGLLFSSSSFVVHRRAKQSFGPEGWRSSFQFKANAELWPHASRFGGIEQFPTGIRGGRACVSHAESVNILRPMMALRVRHALRVLYSITTWHLMALPVIKHHTACSSLLTHFRFRNKLHAAIKLGRSIGPVHPSLP